MRASRSGQSGPMAMSPGSTTAARAAIVGHASNVGNVFGNSNSGSGQSMAEAARLVSGPSRAAGSGNFGVEADVR